jgi:hypothetical protein
VREAALREVLRELCAELDRRALLACAGIAVLGLSACAEARLPAADARIDGRSVDVGHAVAMYAAPGCSFAGRSR